MAARGRPARRLAGSPADANSLSLVVTDAGGWIVSGADVETGYGFYTIQYDIYLQNDSSDVSAIQVSAVLDTVGPITMTGTITSTLFGPSPSGGTGFLVAQGDPTSSGPGTLTWTFASVLESLAPSAASPGWKLGSLSVTATYAAILTVGLLLPGDQLLDGAGLPTTATSASSSIYSDGPDPSVPEPSSMLMVGLGLALLGCRGLRTPGPIA